MLALGIDGGGTKTFFSLCDETGRVLRALRRPTVALLQVGEEGQRAALEEGARAVLRGAGLPWEAPALGIASVCFGASCWGESKTGDEAMRRSMRRVFAGAAWRVCNDAEVAWAGSFALRPGINILAGTGTMSFGMDAHGEKTRCGGWGEHYGDEGSGYWLGKRALSLFCKEADGRLPMGALYGILRAHFHLDSDFDLHEATIRDVLPYRDKVAELQLLLLEAARQGDENAVDAYREAGREIALNVNGILNRLDFPEGAEVSYSGGIFHTEALVMDSFREALEARGCTIVRPLAPPWIGALMLALQLVGADTPEALARLIEAGAMNG